MNVESGVVVPRHQPFDFVGVKDFLIFQRGQKLGMQAHGINDRGAPPKRTHEKWTHGMVALKMNCRD